MSNESMIDSWLDWQFKDEYKQGKDGIWYPIDNKTNNNERKDNNG